MNRRREGFMSIMVLFVFLLCALTLLFVLAMLERRALFSKNDLDSIQAQYIPEAMGNYYLDEILSSLDFTREAEEKGAEKLKDLPLTKIDPNDITDVKVRYEKRKGAGDYPTFALTITSYYKKIGASATYMGDLVAPLFRREESFLSLNTLEGEESEKIQDLLTGPYLQRVNRDLSPVIIEAPSLMKKVGPLQEITLLDEEKTTLYRATPKATRYYEIKSDFVCDGENFLTGVLRLGPEAQLSGNLTVYGILVIDEGAQVEGTITVEGLVIAPGQYGGKISTRKNPQRVSELLGGFPGFYEPKVEKVKKGFL